MKRRILLISALLVSPILAQTYSTISPTAVTTLTDDSTTDVSSRVRQFTFSITAQGDNWVSLGSFTTGTSHKLVFGMNGNQANSSGEVEFGVTHSSFNVHRVSYTNHQSTAKFYCFWEGSGELMVYLKYNKTVAASLAHTLTVKHTSSRSDQGGDWNGNYRVSPGTFLTSTDLMQGNLESVYTHSGTQIPTTTVNADFSVNGAATANGSPILTEATSGSFLSSSFVERGAPLNGAILQIGTNASATGLNAIAVGEGAIAVSGSNGSSYALGRGAYAGSSGSVALGSESKAYDKAFAALGGTARGYTSAAIGSGNNVYSNASYAVGFYNTIGDSLNPASHTSKGMTLGYNNNIQHISGGNTSYAFGDGMNILSANTYGIGYNNSFTSGTSDSVALGHSNQMSEIKGVTIGANNINDASSSIILGSDSHTQNSASFSTVVGRSNSSYFIGETVLGQFSTMGNQYQWTHTEQKPVFRVGSGASGSLADVLIQRRNGRLTVRNKGWDSGDPTADASAANDNGEAFVVEGHTRLKGKVIIEAPQGDISMGIFQ